MRILAVGPHPDDVEFGCAAVLIKEVKKGNQVHILVLTRGEAGTRGTPEGREQEARNAAAVIGATIQFLDMGGDCHIEHKPQNGFAIARVIREFRPEVVLAPNVRENQHPDHIAVGNLTRDACRYARYGGLEELKPLPVHKIENLYFYNITQHFGHVPGIIVDVSDVVDQWEAAIKCHGSQMDTRSYLSLQKTAARMLGISCGVEYAVALEPNDPLMLDVSEVRRTSRNF